MVDIETIGYSHVHTHKKVLWQDIPNSHLDFTSNTFYQDYTLLSIPANHMVLGVKISLLVNFDVGAGIVANMYVGNQSVIIPSPVSPNYVTNVNDCFGKLTLTVPNGIDPTYQYGSFRWFNFSSPGSTNAISTAYCVPKTTAAQDIIARIVVTQTSGVSVSDVLAGAVEITTHYGAF